MKLERVYVASNGDIFVAYDADSEFTEQPQEDVARVIAEARRMLEAGLGLFANAKVSKSDIVPQHVSYYSLDGEFIATAGMHVMNNYDPSSRWFYLRRLSAETENEVIYDKMRIAMGSLIPLKEWAIMNGIAPDNARQRANRGTLKTAKKVGRDWVIDRNEEPVIRRNK